MSFAAVAALVLSLGIAVTASTSAQAVSTSISGKVTLPEGAPISYYSAISVHVSQTDGPSWGYTWVDITDGTYTVAGLAAGTYRVSFAIGDGINPPPPLAPQYYSGQDSDVTANLVDTSSGDATGINATLLWVGAISGVVTVASGVPTTSMQGLVVVAHSATNGDFVTRVDAGSGYYMIANLPNDTYSVYFQASLVLGGDTTLLNEVYNDVYDPSDGTPVVVAGAAISGINAELSRTGHFTSIASPTITHLGLGVGATLGIASGGSWSPAPDTFTKRWYRNGVAISGATGTQYELTPADLGATITFKLTAVKAGYTSVTRTTPGLLIPMAFTKTATPTITYAGTLASGRVLTAHRGSWSPTPSATTYAWKRDGIAIGGATGATYTLAPADRGHQISVSVTGARSGYVTKTRTSASLNIPRAFTTVTPTITGTAKAGKTLTAHRGTWVPTPSFTYRWYRNGAAISGATHSTYTLTASDKGKSITVKVTGTKTGYLTATKTSAAVVVAK